MLIGKAREHDWRQTAHVFDAIVGGCHARADVPADVAATERGRVHAELDAVIADAADIDELRIRESTRRCCALRENRVPCLPREVREIDRQALEERRLEPGLEFLGALRLESRVTGELWRYNRLIVRPGAGDVGLEGGERVRLLS